jgi:hypothetical protein
MGGLLQGGLHHFEGVLIEFRHSLFELSNKAVAFLVLFKLFCSCPLLRLHLLLLF